jgi:hypothetical protein
LVNKKNCDNIKMQQQQQQQQQHGATVKIKY